MSGLIDEDREARVETFVAENKPLPSAYRQGRRYALLSSGTTNWQKEKLQNAYFNPPCG